MTGNQYLLWILENYKARDLSLYSPEISRLQAILRSWASSCLIEILNSGSRAKNTAIHLASDVDYLVSLVSSCNENAGWLKSIYDSLFQELQKHYPIVRKQNVSFGIKLRDLEVDIIPARKHSGNTSDHWLYVSKKETRQQTNIQRHINNISQSWRNNEIKLLKIWRKFHNLDFSSIYMEYLLINVILSWKPKSIDNLEWNFLHILSELARDTLNPLYTRIQDPANSSNILSDLLNQVEKNAIIRVAKVSISKWTWWEIIH